MKNRLRRNLLIKFLLVLTTIFGYASFNDLTAQKSIDKLNPALPFKQCWSFPANISDYDIASDNAGNIFVTQHDGKLLALDSKYGIKLWETELGGLIISEPAYDDLFGNVYVVTKPVKLSNTENQNEISSNLTTSAVKISSLDTSTGIADWKISLPLDLDTKRMFVFAVDHKIIAVDQNGSTVVLRKTDGQILSGNSFNLELSNVYFDSQNKHFLLLSKKKVIEANFENSNLTVQPNTKSNLTTAYQLNKNAVILGNKKGEIFAVNINTGRHIWKARAGAEISNIIRTYEGLLATSFDNFIYLFDPENGRLIWKKRMENRIIIKPYLFDDSVIVITLGSQSAAVLNLKTGSTINQISLPSDSFFTNRPVVNSRTIIFPTSAGITAFVNSDEKCAAE